MYPKENSLCIRRLYRGCCIPLFTKHPLPMTKKNRTWYVTLHPSNLTPIKDALVPQVRHPRSYTLDDVLQRVSHDKSIALEPENVRHAVGLFLRKVEEMLLEGSIVRLPIGRLTPTVNGIWGTSRRYDPDVRAQNQATVRYSVSPRLQRLMDEQILLQDTPGGTKFFIHTVKDNKSGSISDRITPGGIVFIYGQQLLMNGDLPERGVYLLRADTMDVACHLTPDTFALCTRGRIALQLPADLAPGQYRLKVVSQCSTSPKPLKKARAYLWPGVLTVQHENEE